MNHELDRDDDLIDLGAASVETKGNIGQHGDVAGLLPNMGLSDD
jgi:hypothetical protein